MLIIQFNFASIYNSLKEDITLIVWIYHIVLNFSQSDYICHYYVLPVYRYISQVQFTYSFYFGDLFVPHYTECPENSRQIENNVSEKRSLHGIKWVNDSNGARHYSGNKHTGPWNRGSGTRM